MQSDTRSLSSIVKEIRTALLPNAPPLLPHSSFSSTCITYYLSSLASAPVLTNAPSAPHRKKAQRGEELASPSHISMAGDSQKDSGTSSNLRECEINTPIGFEQYL
jgi:hypothetical protein